MTRRFFSTAVFAISAIASLDACDSGGGSIVAQPLPASTTILVGQSRTVSLATAGVAADVTVPSAAGGNGSITIAVSPTGPIASSTSVAASVVTPPGTPIAFVTLATNGTATYDTFPTTAFTLSAPAPANASFYLNYTSPTYYLGSIAGPVFAINGSEVVFSQTTFGPIFYPATSNSTPPLPFVLTSGGTYTFGVYEVIEATPTPANSDRHSSVEGTIPDRYQFWMTVPGPNPDVPHAIAFANVVGVPS